MSPGPGRRAPALLLVLASIGLPFQIAPAAPADPSVSIDFPFAGDVEAGTVNVSGTSREAQYVNVSIDGGGWNRASGIEDWTWQWNTSGYADGTHTLLASAVNGSRTSGVISIQVAVNNTPPSRLELSLDVESREVYAGENFALSGLARFDTGVRPAGLPVTVTVGNSTLDAITDRRGYYSATALAPATPGDLQVRVEASASGLAASVQDRVSVVPREPADLSVSPGDIRFTPAEPFSDEDITVGAVIHNLGGGNATARVNFSTPGLPDAVAQVSVPGGESRNPTAVWRLAAGNHTVNVTISAIQPYDSNSSNDRASTSLVVLSRPDLVLAALVASNPRPYSGLNITLQARVNNTGDRDAAGTVRFYDGPLPSGAPLGSRPVTVAARSSASVYLVWNATVVGEHILYAVITDVSPRESNENNNQLGDAVTVRKRPAVEEPPGLLPGPGLPALLLAAAAILVKSAVSRRKS